MASTDNSAAKASGTDTLYAADQLAAGESIVSTNGVYSLWMQTDNNLVVYKDNEEALWSSGTDHGDSESAHLIFQGDGNFCLYDRNSRECLWSSDTHNTGADRAVMQDDGNLVVYAGDEAVWSSGTSNKSADGEETETKSLKKGGGTLYAADQLAAGESLVSENGVYSLWMQTDNNLVVYKDNEDPLWSSGTNQGDYESAHCIFQEDNNFCVYNRNTGECLWSSGTQNTGADRAVMQDDGNLVVYAGDEAVWSSGTSNKSADGGETGTKALKRGGGTLYAADQLAAGESLVSENGVYSLWMQTDNNLVVYRDNETALWSSGTDQGDSDSAHCIFQEDNNFCVYDRNTGECLWSSDTHNTGADRAVMQDDGNLVVYAGDEAVWSSGTAE